MKRHQSCSLLPAQSTSDPLFNLHKIRGPDMEDFSCLGGPWTGKASPASLWPCLGLRKKKGNREADDKRLTWVSQFPFSGL